MCLLMPNLLFCFETEGQNLEQYRRPWKSRLEQSLWCSNWILLEAFLLGCFENLSLRIWDLQYPRVWSSIKPTVYDHTIVREEKLRSFSDPYICRCRFI